MPNETTNYKLKKPLVGESYDVGIQNQNMDIIDTNLKALETNVSLLMPTKTNGDAVVNYQPSLIASSIERSG